MKMTFLASIAGCMVILCTTSAQAATTELEVAGAGIRVDVDESAFRHGTRPIFAWITRSAQIVAHYYDRFPTASLRLHVAAEDGGGVRTGKTFGYNGGVIRVEGGRDGT